MPTSAPITSRQATGNPTSTSKAGQATDNPTSKAESAKVHCLFVIALSSAAADPIASERLANGVGGGFVLFLLFKTSALALLSHHN
eukprot:scaffold41619_cov322-Skeletonema_dohrnii-CCMP3373.AAC.1